MMDHGLKMDSMDLKQSTMFLDHQYMFPSFQQQLLNGNTASAASMFNLNGAMSANAGGDESLTTLGGGNVIAPSMKKPSNGQPQLSASLHNNNNDPLGNGHRSLAAIEDDRVKRPMNAFMVI